MIAHKSFELWGPLLNKFRQVKGGDPNKSLQSYLEEIKPRGRIIHKGFEERVSSRFGVDITKEVRESLEVESGGEFEPKAIREKLFGKWEPNTKPIE